jgi:beta-lactamase regulating signal transducer with metallopeptidase domain
MTPAVLSYATSLLDAWSANLWPACWQGGLVVFAIWTILRLLPSMPARCQCWFWRLGMLKFAVVLLLPPLLDVPLLPAPVVEAQVKTRLSVAKKMPARQTEQVHVSMAETTEWSNLPTILHFVWLIGVGCSFLWFSFAWNAVRQLKKRSRTITDGPIIEQLRIQTRLFCLRAMPKLIEVPGGGSPMLLGMFWPSIVIPAKTRLRLNATEQTMVLGHELAHIRRGDVFWGLIASLVRSVFFFHPLVWFCERQLKLAQEVAADELAISKQSHDPLRYGNLLVSVVGKLGLKRISRPLVSTISLETAGPVYSLTRRLAAMSRIGRTSRRVLVCTGILLGVVVLLGLVPWRLVAAEPKENQQKSSWYAAKIRFTRKLKNQPEAVTYAPTMTYHAGQWVFVSVDYDKKELLLVTVGSSPEGQPVKHWIRVRGLRNLDEKELTKDDIKRLIDEDTKHISGATLKHTGLELPKGQSFGIAYSPGNLTSVVFLGCDQQSRIADYCNEDTRNRGYLGWQSDRLEVPTGATSTIRVARPDGSQSIDINVIVSPTEKPTIIAAEPKASDSQSL